MTDDIREATESLEQARAERDKLPQGEARQAMNRALDRVEVAISKAALVQAHALEDAALLLDEAAGRLLAPKRVSQVDARTADILQSKAAAIRALKPVAS